MLNAVRNWWAHRSPHIERASAEHFESDTELALTHAGTATPMGRAVPAMRSAISLLSHTLATLPRYIADMNGVEESNHPLTALLNRTDPRWPADAVWEYLYRSALTHGYGLGYLVRQGGLNGHPVRIIPCDANQSTIRTGSDGRVESYRLKTLVGLDIERAQPRDVLLVVGDGYDGIRGVSPITAYALTLGILTNAMGHLDTTLRKGMHVSGVVESDPEVGQGMGWDLPRIATLRKKLVELFAGVANAGGTPVLPPGFKFHPVPYNAVDIELVRLLELSIEDVCRIYRVPPRLIYHFRSGIRYQAAGAEMDNADFAQYSIEPRARYLGSMVGSQLLVGQTASGAGKSIRFETDRLYAGTITERIRAMDLGVARAGVIKLNEARVYIATGRLPRMVPLPDGDRVLDPKGAPEQPRDGDPNPPDSGDSGED